jgi:hypothetical protein
MPLTRAGKKSRISGTPIPDLAGCPQMNSEKMKLTKKKKRNLQSNQPALKY